jgi:hypothetical protein
MPHPAMPHPAMHALRVVLVLGGLASLVSFGIAGIGRSGIFNFDGRVLYAAGSTWLQNGNPYDHHALARSVANVPDMDLDAVGFFYPPQSAGICIFLALFPYSIARLIWLLLNLSSLAAIVAMTISIMRDHKSGSGVEADRWGPWVIAAIVIGNPFTTHVVWMGQTTLLSFAAVLGTWLFAGRKKWLLAGICFGLASFKPQISILLGLWLLLEKDWKTLSVGALTASAMALYPMVTQGGPLGALLAWRTGVSSDYALASNLPGFSHKVGVESLLYAIDGTSIPGSLLMAASAVLAAALWRFGRRIDRNDLLALLMIITLTFSVYLHDYDYVALIPAFVSLWWCARAGQGYAVAAGVLLVTLFLPQRGLHVLGFPLLEQWRTLVVAAMGTVILYAAITRRSNRESTAIGALE